MKIQTVDASYVKGFFDGEGCIHKISNDTESWTLVIVNTEFNLMKNVSNFLKTQKIRHRLVIRKKGKYKDILELSISSVYNIYKFYKIIGCCSKPKEKKFNIMIKNSKKLKRIFLRSSIEKLRTEGLSYIKIGKKFDILPGTCWKILNHKYKDALDYQEL